jgi:hypothetical protein
MAREFYTDVDLKGALLLDGSPGVLGQIPYSAGPGAPATWADPPSGGGSTGNLYIDGGSALNTFVPGLFFSIDGGAANG